MYIVDALGLICFSKKTTHMYVDLMVCKGFPCDSPSPLLQNLPNIRHTHPSQNHQAKMESGTKTNSRTVLLGGEFRLNDDRGSEVRFYHVSIYLIISFSLIFFRSRRRDWIKMIDVVRRMCFDMRPINV